MSRKTLSEVRGSLEYRITNFWFRAGVFDADKIIDATKKIVNFINAQELSLEQLETRINEAPLLIQKKITNQIDEHNTLEDILNWKNKRDENQMILLVEQLICSKNVRNPDVIIDILKVIRVFICSKTEYLESFTNNGREKCNLRQLLLTCIAETNDFKLPNIDIYPTIKKIEEFLFDDECNSSESFIGWDGQRGERNKIFTIPKGAIVKICGASVVLQGEVEALGDPNGVKHMVDLYEQLDAQNLPCEYIGEDISFNDFRKLNPCIE